LLVIAIAFMRKQIKPIVELAHVARSFGMGHDVSSFMPRGATEVKQAAHAFLNMKERIERHVEQRTAMLAGVPAPVLPVPGGFVLPESLPIEPIIAIFRVRHLLAATVSDASPQVKRGKPIAQNSRSLQQCRTFILKWTRFTLHVAVNHLRSLV
jgi:hypothetical protein